MNPIVTLRKSLGMTRVEAAQKMGVSYQDLTLLENGYPLYLPGRVMDALPKLGANSELIAAEYKAWREARG